MNKHENLLDDLSSEIRRDWYYDKNKNIANLKARILKAMEPREVVITEEKMSSGMYVCPNLECARFIEPGGKVGLIRFQYCPGCGAKITWRLKDE